LTYLVLTCRKTPINQSINQSIFGQEWWRMAKRALLTLRFFWPSSVCLYVGDRF